MTQLIVRNLEEGVVQRLKQRAAQRARSMEEEVRRVLRESVRDELNPAPLGTRMAARFAGLGFEGGLPELRGSEAVASDFHDPAQYKAQALMILLDTNVVSALMAQDEAVVAWLDAQAAESLWRRALEEAFAALLTEDLGDRVAAFGVVNPWG